MITKNQLTAARFEVPGEIGFITFTPLRNMKTTKQFTVRQDGIYPLWTGETITSINRAIKNKEIKLIK